MNKPKNYTLKRDLLTRPELGEVRGVKSSWSSIYGPGFRFNGGLEKDHPCKAIRAGKKK